MKKTVLLLVLTFSILTITTIAQKTGVIKVNTSYTGVLDGYDHINKTLVYLDGVQVGETSEELQSKPNSCIVSADRGKHSIRIINMAKYEGTWEEHTIANEYSIDALYEGEIKLRKEMTINLIFDITKEKTFAKVE